MTHYFHLLLASQPWWRHYDCSPPTEVPPWGSHYFTMLMWRRDTLHAAKYQPPHDFANSCMGEARSRGTGGDRQGRAQRWRAAQFAACTLLLPSHQPSA